MKAGEAVRRRARGRVALGLALLLLVTVGTAPAPGQQASPGGSPGGTLPTGLLTGSVLSGRHPAPSPLSHAQVRVVGPRSVRWA
ncbi:MAG: hypothetical protein ACOC8K_04920, partial [Gemmatimonadota bacterium]